MIKIDNVSKTYVKSDDTRILDNVHLTIPEGSWMTIQGPSGSGKTTLLNCVSGLLRPTSGDVYYDDVDVYKLSDKFRSDFRRKLIGFIFQDFKLLPYYSVIDNVILPIIYEDKKKTLYTKAKSILKTVGIQENLYNRLPGGLSGGEKQRVATARALMTNPDVLICDEPTGNLDLANRDLLMELLNKLHGEGKTILLVTHDPEVANYGTSTFYLKDGVLSEAG